MAKRYAGVLALIAFAAVCLNGVVTGQTFARVVGHALAALGAFGLLGCFVGALARRAVEESVKAELAEREQASSEPPSAPAE